MTSNFSRLHEIADVVDSLHKTPKYSDEGRAMVRVTDVRYGSLKLEGTLKVSEEIFLEFSRRYTPQVGDIVITRVGSFGNTAMVDDCGFCLGQNTAAIIPKIDPHYLYAVLNSKQVRDQIEFSAVGSTQKTLSLKAIKNLEIPRLSSEREKFVSKLAKSLDQKIELNSRTNQTLEQIAQTLFKSWFVDFDPVRAKVAVREHFEQRAAEHAEPLPAPTALEEAQNIVAAATIAGLSFDPADIDGTRGLLEEKLARMEAEQRAQLLEIAAQFPDELAITAIGESPVGWQVMPLDTIAKYQNGLALQKFRPENEDDFLPVLKIAHLKKGCTDGEEKASRNISESCKVYDGDVIFSWSGSLVVDIWCGGEAALNQHLFKVTSKDFPKWFYYQFTKHHLQEFQRIAAAKAVTMGHIKREHLRQALCTVPSVNFIKKVSGTFTSLTEKVISLRLESRLLAEMRDALLPKLLSGEIQLNPEPVAEAS